MRRSTHCLYAAWLVKLLLGCVITLVLVSSLSFAQKAPPGPSESQPESKQSAQPENKPKTAQSPYLKTKPPPEQVFPPGSKQDIEKSLNAARAQIYALRQSLHKAGNDAQLQRNRATALDIQSNTDAIVKKLTPHLTDVQARLTELGPPPQKGREAANIATQRAALEHARSDLDTHIRLARLLSVEVAQTAAQISILRRTQFHARLDERQLSILTPLFWSEFQDDFPEDLDRLRQFGRQLAHAFSAPPLWLWLLLGLGVVFILGLWVKLKHYLLQLITDQISADLLRRSLYILAPVLLATLIPGIIAQLIFTGLDWRGRLSEDMRSFLSSLVGLICFGGFISSLGVALLSPTRPAWRLFNIPERIAQRMIGVAQNLGPIIVLIGVLDQLPIVLNAGLNTTIAMNSVAALLLIATLTFGLKRLKQAIKQTLYLPDGYTPTTPRVAWLMTGINIAWLIPGLLLVSVLTGYVAFGNFVTKQIIWVAVVLTTAYVLCVLVDAFFTTLFHPPQSEAALAPPHPQSRLRAQTTVLLSGVIRLFIALFGLMLLIGQFRGDPFEFLQSGERVRNGLMIGAIQLQPATLIQAILVFVAGLCIIRLLKHWLLKNYLPTTALDSGMQISTTTLFGYASSVIAAGLALSVLGIGLDRLAWVASALSVGIGFGLQAIFQNFVSGLILLTERPVKVGDWVSLSGVEGDIISINVRATEIRMGDRSTVIVPNSQFITTIVRNVTLASPLGLVQIKFALPLSVNAEQVKEVLTETFQAHEAILRDPAPNVFLDSMDSQQGLTFNAVGYVSSPRLSYATRSALLFDLLKRLTDAGISLSKPPTLLLSAPSNTSAHKAGGAKPGLSAS